MANGSKAEMADQIRKGLGVGMEDSDDDVIRRYRILDPKDADALQKAILSGPSGFADQHPAINLLNEASAGIQGIQKNVGSATAPIASAISGAANSVANGANAATGGVAGRLADTLVGPQADFLKGVGKVGAFANSGNQELSNLMAENGGIPGAVAGGALSTLSSDTLPTGPISAAGILLGTPVGANPAVDAVLPSAGRGALQGMAGLPEAVPGELEGLKSIRAGLENSSVLKPNGPGLENLLKPDPMSTSGQIASDTVSLGQEGSEKMGMADTGTAAPEMIGKSPAEGFSQYINDRISQLQGGPQAPAMPPSDLGSPAIPGTPGESTLSSLYGSAKEKASNIASDMTTQLLNWFPRIRIDTARRLADNPDMVNTALPLEQAQQAYTDYSNASGMLSGRDAFTNMAKEQGSSSINYQKIADGAWSDLKDVSGSDFTKAQAQKALIGRQAYGEMLKNKWKNPALDYDENAAASMQSDLDDKLSDYDPKLTALRNQYADSATVDQLNHVLPQNQNMTPNKLQLTGVLAAAAEAAHGGALKGLGTAGVGLAASSPYVAKGALSAAGLAGRDIGLDGLANMASNGTSVPINAATNQDK